MKSWTRHLPNAVTLLRPVLACIFIALLPGRFAGSIGATVPLLVFACICVSDFLDGRIARALDAVSKTGACLDLYSDFFYITASLVTLNILGQTPVWFTVVVILKFFEYLMTSRILRRGCGTFVPDPLGRAAAGLFFITPGLTCGLFGLPVFYSGVLRLAAGAAFASSVMRWLSCTRTRIKRVVNKEVL